MPTIAIRVSDEDHKLFTALAEREFMPLSILVRRVLHAEAVRAALILDPIAEAKRTLNTDAAPAKPAIVRLPIPANGNLWNDTIYSRLRNGESPSDIGESYGVSAQDIKDRAKRAKDNAESEAYGAPKHEIIRKEVLNDPEQMRVINDAKFAALMANMQETPPAP